MTPEFRDAVADTTTTTGTGTLTLAGSPPSGSRGFSAHTNGATVRVRISNVSQTEWEVVGGIWSSAGNTLSRVTVYASSNAGALVDFTAGTKTVTEVMVATNLQTGDQQVRVQNGNGYGSTNTRIRRFTNALINVGTDITYADSATAGASFTINTAGIYAISYTDIFSAASNVGVSLNSSDLTNNINAITAATRIALSTTGAANFAASLGVTLKLAAGDVIRPHAQGTTESASPERAEFRIIRVA